MDKRQTFEGDTWEIVLDKRFAQFKSTVTDGLKCTIYFDNTEWCNVCDDLLQNLHTMQLVKIIITLGTRNVQKYPLILELRIMILVLLNVLF